MVVESVEFRLLGTGVVRGHRAGGQFALPLYKERKAKAAGEGVVGGAGEGTRAHVATTGGVADFAAPVQVVEVFVLEIG